MRLFVAAELSEDLVDALSETSARLRSCVRGRYVGPDLFHVTLAFLGERPGTEVPRLADALEQVCAGQKAFSTTLGPLGTFGRKGSAVLWQGFAEGGSAWQELARSVQDALAPLGYKPEHTRFVPPVTLMRRADMAHGTLPMPCVEKGLVNTVTLFSSDLSGERPRYEALFRVELGAATSCGK